MGGTSSTHVENYMKIILKNLNPSLILVQSSDFYDLPLPVSRPDGESDEFYQNDILPIIITLSSKSLQIYRAS